MPGQTSDYASLGRELPAGMTDTYAFAGRARALIDSWLSSSNFANEPPPTLRRRLNDWQLAAISPSRKTGQARLEAAGLAGECRRRAASCHSWLHRHRVGGGKLGQLWLRYWHSFRSCRETKGWTRTLNRFGLLVPNSLAANVSGPDNGRKLALIGTIDAAKLAGR